MRSITYLVARVRTFSDFGFRASFGLRISAFGFRSRLVASLIIPSVIHLVHLHPSAGKIMVGGQQKSSRGAVEGQRRRTLRLVWVIGLKLELVICFLRLK